MTGYKFFDRKKVCNFTICLELIENIPQIKLQKTPRTWNLQLHHDIYTISNKTSHFHTVTKKGKDAKEDEPPDARPDPSDATGGAASDIPEAARSGKLIWFIYTLFSLLFFF